MCESSGNCRHENDQWLLITFPSTKSMRRYKCYAIVSIKNVACVFSFLDSCWECSQSLVVSALAAENPSAGDLSTAIAIVSKQTIPAVAHIEVTQRQEINNPLLPFENDPFFHYFFNAPRKMPKKFKREMKGLGSGMVMDSEGHILTNNHVVAGANEIEVLLADGNRYTAKLVGADPKTDLAVIQIKADGKLPYVVFGDSDKMEVGHWVIAIGHPRGLDQTVTQGIISAKHRRGILDPTSYQDYLQTDAAINPGNSGGPLLNLEGQVIGVNAAIVSESGGFEGIGFAIPSNMAVYISRSLIAHGKVERGWLGVTIQELTPDLIKAMNLKISKGALIADLVKGGPADVAGIQKGDVVTAYQGKEIPNGSALQNEIANTEIGQEAMVTVLSERENERPEGKNRKPGKCGQKNGDVIERPSGSDGASGYGKRSPAIRVGRRAGSRHCIASTRWKSGKGRV